ncbi:DUF177 domain-containing protein [uncultured Alsobacter sp.]|uniref:YceD family protein n=1 Tax=uncultured Alsobacter sp. TaxID=1748258 RepID=UPI0025EAF3DB|nr:DUF177 domain-containing protein [uncultured Alsobacter sp.]
MTQAPAKPSPLARPLRVDTIPGLGLETVVEASEQERAALAKEFGLASIEELKGTYKVNRRGRTVLVDGKVTASVTQTCVVTLEPFPAKVDEPVALKFTDDPVKLNPADEAGEHEAPVDAPDPIVDGRVDLGAVTAEFLALALDPYPRKPGVDFTWDEGAPEPSPFAALEALKKPPQT